MLKSTLLFAVVATMVFVASRPVLAKDAKTDGWAYPLPATDDGLAGAGPVRRHEWFQNVWERRRTTFAQNADASKNAVVFLGDSITQGWGDDFRGDFAGMKTTNRGISGDTTRGMLFRLQEDVLNLEPRGVVMLMGTNDLEEGASPETVAGNVALIIDQLKASDAEMPIVLCLVMPSDETKKRTSKDIKEINRLYMQAVKGDAQVTVVDTWSLFAGKDGDAKAEEFPDLLHPNKAGYAKWKAALVPVLETLGLKDTPADDFELEPGFRSLFNGKNLTGWGFRPTTEKMLAGRKRWQSRDPNAPPWPVVTEAVSFDGETSTPDGRYVASNGRLVVTTPPEGRKIQQLWTTEEFPNDFELKLQFRATPNADSGVFLRDPQLQCRDYTIAGPFTNLQNYKPQDWNDLTVVVRGDVAHCMCNDEVIDAAFKVPPTGPIGLEGDRGQLEYRRIRLRELTN